jgi:hypothetical protein
MVDPVFGEQLRKSRTIVLFNRVAEDAKHGGGVHSILPIRSRFVIGPPSVADDEG